MKEKQILNFNFSHIDVFRTKEDLAGFFGFIFLLITSLWFLRIAFFCFWFILSFSSELRLVLNQICSSQGKWLVSSMNSSLRVFLLVSTIKVEGMWFDSLNFVYIFFSLKISIISSQFFILFLLVGMWPSDSQDT